MNGFLFGSDVEDHKEKEGHLKISKYDLSTWAWSEFREKFTSPVKATVQLSLFVVHPTTNPIIFFRHKPFYRF